MKHHTKNELRLPFYYPKTASVFNTELTRKRLQRKSLPFVTCNPLLFRFCLILKSIFSSTNTVKDFREGVLVFKLLEFKYSPYFMKFSQSRISFFHTRIERRGTKGSATSLNDKPEGFYAHTQPPYARTHYLCSSHRGTCKQRRRGGGCA